MKTYYAKIGELSEEEMQKALQILPRERIEKIERNRQKNNRLQSIWAGVLLEYALQEVGITGANLTFLKNADGKPYIKEYSEFYYNLSHSREYVALVVDDCPVGIDVEGIRVGYQKLVTRFFAEEEIEILQKQWSDELFTKLWTRKESYLKATGYGMRMPLNGFSTVEEQVQLNDKMNGEMIEDAVYYLASVSLDDSYWLSVCRKNMPVPTDVEVLVPEQVDLKRFLKKV